jgi:hypothetical protein
VIDGANEGYFTDKNGPIIVTYTSPWNMSYPDIYMGYGNVIGNENKPSPDPIMNGKIFK